MLLARVHVDGERTTVAVAERRLEGFGQPLLEIRANAQPVDHDFERVLAVLREMRHGVDLVYLAIDAHAHETFGAQLEEKLLLLTFAVDDRRRENHQLGFFGQHQRRVDHLRDRHGRELLLGVIRAIGLADPREEQAQVIVDLGDGADGGARVVRGRLLLDRDRRRQAFDDVDVGLVHQLQELAGIRREALDITPLPFGVERVESERALARAGEAGDDDQPMPRQIEVDVLEVMRACAADADVFHRREMRKGNLLVYPFSIVRSKPSSLRPHWRRVATGSYLGSAPSL